jgi:hypothetical protein
MTARGDDIQIRPGRIRRGDRGGKRPQTFVGEVIQAAKKAGHVGDSFHSSQDRSRSRFGRGTRAAVSIRLRRAGGTKPSYYILSARVVPGCDGYLSPLSEAEQQALSDPHPGYQTEFASREAREGTRRRD